MLRCVEQIPQHFIQLDLLRDSELRRQQQAEPRHDQRCDPAHLNVRRRSDPRHGMAHGKSPFKVLVSVSSTGYPRVEQFENGGAIYKG
jgi:hypothetical protein